MGRLLDGLEERGLLEGAYVFFASDHGEGLVEEEDHGAVFHGPTLYDEAVHVPLIVSGPGVKPGRVREPVSLIDLVPTWLDLAQVPLDPALRGTSLRPWMQGLSRRHPDVFFEKQKEEALPQKGMISWPHKVIWKSDFNIFWIFDLEADPGETTNVVRTLPEEERNRLTGLLKHWKTAVLAPVKGVAVRSAPDESR